MGNCAGVDWRRTSTTWSSPTSRVGSCWGHVRARGVRDRFPGRATQLVDEDADWGTTGPVDPSHPSYSGFHDAWRDGDWWASRGYDPWFGRKLPALFERWGLCEIRQEASTEVVRGGSPWPAGTARALRSSTALVAAGAAKARRASTN